MAQKNKSRKKRVESREHSIGCEQPGLKEGRRGLIPLVLSLSAPSLYPSGLGAPAIHKVTVHPTGKHSLQPAITSDCASPCNLETLFTQPKNTSIRWESRVN